jgi:hypothetical protein
MVDAWKHQIKEHRFFGTRIPTITNLDTRDTRDTHDGNDGVLVVRDLEFIADNRHLYMIIPFFSIFFSVISCLIPAMFHHNMQRQ